MVRDLFQHASEEKRRAAFEEFHAANPAVYQEFERRALELIRLGREDFGARQIMESIRYFFAVEIRSNDGFRINNNHVPFYSRLFAERNPEHAGFFKMRERE